MDWQLEIAKHLFDEQAVAVATTPLSESNIPISSVLMQPEGSIQLRIAARREYPTPYCSLKVVSNRNEAPSTKAPTMKGLQRFDGLVEHVWCGMQSHCC